MKKSIKKIGIFDSGIGGLTILKPLLDAFPAHYLYLADSKYAPYGNKSIDELIKRTQLIVAYFESQEVDALILACHTLSALAKPHLTTSLPIITILDCTLETFDYSEKCAVIGTERTIESGAYKKIFQEKQHTIEGIACPKLAQAIEDYFEEKEGITFSLLEALRPLNGKKIDQLILGCTHYNAIAPEIQKLLPSTKLYGSLNLAPWLKEIGETLEKVSTLTLIQTNDNDSFSKKASKLLNQPITEVSFIEI